MSNAHQTGKDVDTSCNRCKLTLAHVIVAMDGSRIVRVKCKTCGSEHAYKHVPATATRGATARKSTAAGGQRKASGPAALYERAIQGRDLSAGVRYRVTQAFAEGDVLDHVNFGLGVVTTELSDNKIEVLFREGARVLVHRR
jgi:ethanolamine ammonia-lyase large subunit